MPDGRAIFLLNSKSMPESLYPIFLPAIPAKLTWGGWGLGGGGGLLQCTLFLPVLENFIHKIQCHGRGI